MPLSLVQDIVRRIISCLRLWSDCDCDCGRCSCCSYCSLGFFSSSTRVLDCPLSRRCTVGAGLANESEIGRSMRGTAYDEAVIGSANMIVDDTCQSPFLGPPRQISLGDCVAQVVVIGIDLVLLLQSLVLSRGRVLQVFRSEAQTGPASVHLVWQAEASGRTCVAAGRSTHGSRPRQVEPRACAQWLLQHPPRRRR